MWVAKEGGYQSTLCGCHKIHKVEKHKEVYLIYINFDLLEDPNSTVKYPGKGPLTLSQHGRAACSRKATFRRTSWGQL